ncbi:hypothetical protein M407DRAFT_241650 [Tulasnella calospora MUT 4182]|uniref:Uncharacterized protein n=1 Tax=Tulasnella calospora MUT 4182 TaxID=1051891 RepID=A0A0C3QIL5_9AGAM|nr:hypothetical protein M407DRAFT_241650 [Tulasnella calospora MUT 4182]
MAFPRPTAASESIIARRKPAKPLKIISRKSGSRTLDRNSSDSSGPSSPVTANSVATPQTSPFNPAFEPIPEGKEAR